MSDDRKLTIEEARKLLEYIDITQLTYDEWVKVGFAINNELPGADGLELWEEWSAQDSRGLFVEGECAYKWKTFTPGGGISGRSLTYLAEEGGYQPKEPRKPRALDWNDELKWDDPIDVDNEPLTEAQANEARKTKTVTREARKSGQEKKDSEPDEETKRMIAAIDARLGKEEANPANVYKDMIEQSIADREGSSFEAYLRFRGFTEEDIKRLDSLEYAPTLGFVRDYSYYNHDKNQYDTMENALLIAETYDGFAVRNMGAGARYMNGSKKQGNLVIPTGITAVAADPHKRNEETGYLEPVFIVEGYLDAPSIMAAGKDAIALNGVANFDRLIELLNHYDVIRPLILALDDDYTKDKNTGQKRQKDLAEALEKEGFEFYQIPGIYQGYDDANDFFSKSRAKFDEALDAARKEVFTQVTERLGFNASQEEAFRYDLLRRNMHPAISTGFEILDSPLYLNGGLRPGLYILGAVSSLGKTTFILQIADQIARAGHDVMFFSLEMSKYELMGKSVSRYTYSGDREPHSLIDIYKRFMNDRSGSINPAINEYFKDTGEHLRILEGFAETDVQRIRQAVINHIDVTERQPVIFIDYLQLLLPPKDPRTRRRQNMTDKQIVDYNVTELKKLSRDLDVPVIAISSFNRDNYTQSVNMTSFKESGAIEYSSDVLIGLQPAYMMVEDKADREIIKKNYLDRWEDTKTKIINLKVLKNRNGWKDYSIMYYYVPAYNYYEEYTEGHKYLDSLGIERRRDRKKKDKKQQKPKELPVDD